MSPLLTHSGHFNCINLVRSLVFSSCGRREQVSLRPGMYTVPAPLRPVMVFVNTGARDKLLGAVFQQNSLQGINRGDEAEIAFDAVPGRVFRGKCAESLMLFRPTRGLGIINGFWS